MSYDFGSCKCVEEEKGDAKQKVRVGRRGLCRRGDTVCFSVSPCLRVSIFMCREEASEVMHVLYAVLLAALALILPGCATSGGETLKIDTRNVVGVQYMPDELTRMLRELGYQWIPIVDPEIEREVKTVQKQGYYSMRFELVETGQVRIDARMRVQDGFTRLHFYEPGSQTLSPSAMDLFQELQKRAWLEFGQTNVSR